jgi:hypothetical protein
LEEKGKKHPKKPKCILGYIKDCYKITPKKTYWGISHDVSTILPVQVQIPVCRKL